MKNIEVLSLKGGILYGDKIGASEYLIKLNPKKYCLKINGGQIQLLELIENGHEKIFKVLDILNSGD